VSFANSRPARQTPTSLRPTYKRRNVRIRVERAFRHGAGHAESSEPHSPRDRAIRCIVRICLHTFCDPQRCHSRLLHNRSRIRRGLALQLDIALVTAAGASALSQSPASHGIKSSRAIPAPRTLFVFAQRPDGKSSSPCNSNRHSTHPKAPRCPARAPARTTSVISSALITAPDGLDGEFQNDCLGPRRDQLATMSGVTRNPRSSDSNNTHWPPA